MGFKKILIGTIFLFAYHYEGFDLLPDFLGYILIFQGLGYVANYNRKFKIAQVIVAFLSLFAFYDLIKILGIILQIQIPVLLHYIFFILDFFLVRLALMLIYNYLLLSGIRDNAEKFGYNGLKERAQKTWHVMIGYTIFSSLYFIPITRDIIFNIGSLYNILLFVFSFIAFIFNIHVLTGARNDLEVEE